MHRTNTLPEWKWVLLPAMNQKGKNLLHPSGWPFFYGYVVALIGTVGIWASVPGQTIGVSTFTDPVKDALSLSRDQFSTAYMLGTLFSSFLLTRAGRWYDRWGARKVGGLAALGLALTLFLSSYVNSISGYIQNTTGIYHWGVPFVVMLLLFFMLRFSGQGILTMSSRNMIMKWFDRYRGRVNAFSSVSISLGFSISPLIFDQLIKQWHWHGAWRILALSVFIVALLIWLFFRDNPEEYGLRPDGEFGNRTRKTKRPVIQRTQFTAGQAFVTRAFWMYALILSFNSFFITGLSFHVVDIFTSTGYERSEAIAIFLPISVISVSFSLLFNFLSDYIPLKVILFIMIGGAFLGGLGLAGLSGGWGLWLTIGGAGIMGGLFAVLNSVAWPNLFGRKHLGAISGKAMSMVVFASALAPVSFSLSKTFLKSYTAIGWVGIFIALFITVGSLKANDPQKDKELKAESDAMHTA